MAEVGRASVIARTKARLHAEEVRRGSAEGRQAVAAARTRRAQRPHRPVAVGSISPLRRSARAQLHDWSSSVETAVVLSRAEEARAQASSLRHETFVLRGAVSWQLRRLRKTQRRVDQDAQMTLVWIDSTDGLDDLID
jgi:hypothetical protein